MVLAAKFIKIYLYFGQRVCAEEGCGVEKAIFRDTALVNRYISEYRVSK